VCLEIRASILAGPRRHAAANEIVVFPGSGAVKRDIEKTDPRLDGESIDDVFRPAVPEIRESWGGPCNRRGPDALGQCESANTLRNRTWINHTALRGVDLVIEDGEWLAVQGPTGHGKSTLLQILGGLDRPSSGIVDFDGRDLAQLRETEVTKVRAQSIGFVFQTFNLIPTLSALENVEAALVPLGVGSAPRRQRAAMALEAVGLGDRLRHVPGELSGGQQQRVAVARALVKEPKVLLADEPTGNLDEDTRDDIIGLLETMWRERGLTMVLVTHDSSIARRAQRIGVMKNGRLTVKQHRGKAPRPASVGTVSVGAGAAGADRSESPGPSGFQPPDLPGRTDLPEVFVEEEDLLE